MKFRDYKLSTIVLSLLLVHLKAESVKEVERVDPQGYVVYCPCMGKLNFHRFLIKFNS